MTDSQFAEIQGSIAALATKMDVFYANLSSSQGEFAEYVGRRFDGVEGRLDRVEGRLDRVEGRLDHVESRLDKVEIRLDRVGDRLSRVEVKVDDGFAAMDVRLRRLEGPRRRK